jgi:uncharacterized protein (TIGR00369 family)
MVFDEASAIATKFRPRLDRVQVCAITARKISPMTREGPFWDVLEGHAERPPAATTLGWKLIGVDPEAGTTEIAFHAREAFLNLAGNVQGGFLAAMLDATLGPALVATLGRGEWAPTSDLHVQFHAPAQPGRLIGRGRVVRRGHGLAHLAGDLRREDGMLVASAMATAAIRSSG